jgi:hypothetical protein
MRIVILIIITQKEISMKTNKIVLALSLIVSAAALNAATDYSAEAKAWIKKNNGVVYGTNFNFKNDMTKSVTFIVPKAGNITLATKGKEQMVKGSVIGKPYHGQKFDVVAGNARKMSVNTLAPNGSAVVYHVVGSGPTLYSYAEDGQVLKTDLIGY